MTVKLLEDELYYESIKNWHEYIEYLNEILTDEINIGVNINDVRRWHNLLNDYFQKKPNSKSITYFMHGIYFTDDAIQEMFENLDIIRSNKKIIEILKNLYKKFDALIT
jgi:hypothetical protein